MPLEQPSIELWGILINEPVTVATDLIVSAVCIYAFVKIIQVPYRGKLKAYLLWYFFLMALATMLGGIIGHAFLCHFDASRDRLKC